MSEQEAYALLFDFREPSDKIVLEAPRVPWDRRAYAAFRPVQRRNGGRGS